MVQRVFGDVKAAIAQISGTSGMPVTDARIMEQVNLAQEELINEGEFPGVVDRWSIISNGSGRLVLPTHLDRILQIKIANQPVELKSPWFQFVGWGPGTDDSPKYRDCSNLATGQWWDFWCGPDNILDVGEFPTYERVPNNTALGWSDLPGPWRLRVYASPTTDETPGAYLLAQGYSAFAGSGAPEVVRTQIPTITNGTAGTEWINGERIAISSGSAFAQSIETFSSLTSVTKPVTKGYVRLTAWNGTTEVELSNYAPTETTPSYHHYFSPWLSAMQAALSADCCRTVVARCRRRFVPVAVDSDPLIITNLPALRQMIRAIWQRDADEIDKYIAMKTTAVDLLKKEAMAYRGKTRTPSFVFGRGYAMGALPALR